MAIVKDTKLDLVGFIFANTIRFAPQQSFHRDHKNSYCNDTAQGHKLIYLSKGLNLVIINQPIST